MTYFEVMTSNIWLPEDLLAGIAKYTSEPGAQGAPGLWGTALGQELRLWFAILIIIQLGAAILV